MTDNLEDEKSSSSSDDLSVGGSIPRNLYNSGDPIPDEKKEDEHGESSKDVEDLTDSKSDADVQPDSAQSEKIVMTKEEQDAKEMRIREIEHRKAKRATERELEAKHQQELDAIKQQQVQQPAYSQPGIPPQPSPNHLWDQSINQWVDPNMTLMDYANLTSQANPQQNIGYTQPVGQSQMVNQQPGVNTQSQPEKAPSFSLEAENQADECIVAMKDFKEVMHGAPVSREMIEAACLDPSGMRNLYQMVKDSPHELYKILKLPAKEQEHKMWLMNRRFADEKANKLKSKATPQASPLNNTGDVNKSESELSLEELKKKRFAERWKEGG